MPSINEPAVILVMHNDGFVAFDLEGALTHAGYRVLGPAMRSGRALEIIENDLPSAALISLRRDDQSSLEVARKLAAASVPIAFVDGFVSPDVADEFPNAFWLSTPLSDRALLYTVDDMLSPSRTDERRDD